MIYLMCSHTPALILHVCVLLVELSVGCEYKNCMPIVFDVWIHYVQFTITVTRVSDCIALTIKY